MTLLILLAAIQLIGAIFLIVFVIPGEFQKASTGNGRGGPLLIKMVLRATLWPVLLPYRLMTSTNHQ